MEQLGWSPKESNMALVLDPSRGEFKFRRKQKFTYGGPHAVHLSGLLDLEPNLAVTDVSDAFLRRGIL